ncbi:DUF1345 domain-containing protein [Leucobacter ruminantium]|uniref:DUF1345 domain-containing protein n=1 Tax=Leucobacter ruminantium TaxID=1289170 RepID=A0A939M1L7_9MICO|nr:DUF1345 domain-containing protein [Leucobacter ruminantium]MBO1806342.1 DUF1345 domain-containing protein [Leucobacter ruminantium]
MIRRRSPRTIPLRYDDGFRGAIAMVASFLVLLIVALAVALTDLGALRDLPWFMTGACLGLAGFSFIFVIWTHRVFTGASPEEAKRIAGKQYLQGPSRISRLLGFGDEGNWALTAAATALVVAIAAAAIGARSGGLWLPVLVLATAASSWATMVYAFALRYFRLHSAGECIEFDLDPETEGEPRFIDFVSMSVMVSSVGALSAGHPRTRAGLAAVRTHTFIAFAFNALVVAMTVSLVTALITSV